jgi:hypothetical protein
MSGRMPWEWDVLMGLQSAALMAAAELTAWGRLIWIHLQLQELEGRKGKGKSGRSVGCMPDCTVASDLRHEALRNPLLPRQLTGS